MKKSLFLIATAALVLASCNNDVKIAENKTLGNEPQEIGFFPLTSTQKRAISNTNYGYINGTTFDQSWGMTVTAVDVTDDTKSFFDATDFVYNPTLGKWNGDPTHRYWPLSPIQVNFLAIAHANGNNSTGVSWQAKKTAHQVEVVMSDNYAYSNAQRDFIYAIGNGAVTQSGNSLTFPDWVDMQFKHTQAYLIFRAKAYDIATGNNIKIKNIQINGARTQGKATIVRTNPGTYANDAVSLFWTAAGYPGGSAAEAYHSVTPNQNAFNPVQEITPYSFVEIGHLLVVPYMTAANTFAEGGFTTFKIIYTLNDHEYEYVYTPATTKLEAGKKYTYDITFKLHEILVNPTVTDWDAHDFDGSTNGQQNLDVQI